MFLKKISTATTTFTQIWQVRNLWVVLLSTLFFACDDPEEIGSEIFGQDIGVLFTDTLAVNSSTIQLDSLQSSGTSLVFVGNTNHPEMGDISAKAFFQVSNADTLKIDTLGTKAYKTSIIETADSLSLHLHCRFVSGDTNKAQTYKVYRVKSTATPSVSTVYNVNSELPAYDATPIGTLTMSSLHPIRDPYASADTGKYAIVKIPISKSVANEIFALRNKESASAIVYDKFKDIIKGLVVVSESANNAAILGFSTYNSELKLFYHYTYTYPKSGVDTTVTTSKALSFYLANGTTATGEQNARFTKVTTKRAGALSKLVNAADILPANEANYKVCVDNGTGLAMKVRFPSLLKLKNNKDVAINKAELVFEPDATVPGFVRTKELIAIEDNGANRPIRKSNIFSFLNSETQICTYAAKTNTFTFNVTSAVQNIISGRNPNNGWIVTPTWIGLASSSATARTVLSSSRLISAEHSSAIFDSRKIKLKVYYTYVSK